MSTAATPPNRHATTSTVETTLPSPQPRPRWRPLSLVPAALSTAATTLPSSQPRPQQGVLPTVPQPHPRRRPLPLVLAALLTATAPPPCGLRQTLPLNPAATTTAATPQQSPRPCPWQRPLSTILQPHPWRKQLRRSRGLLHNGKPSPLSLRPRPRRQPLRPHAALSTAAVHPHRPQTTSTAETTPPSPWQRQLRRPFGLKHVGGPSPLSTRPQPQWQLLLRPCGLIRSSGPSPPSRNHIHSRDNSAVPVASSTVGPLPLVPVAPTRAATSLLSCGLIHNGDPSPLSRNNVHGRDNLQRYRSRSLVHGVGPSPLSPRPRPRQ